MNAREELEAITRDMDAAYAAIRKAGYPSLDSHEHQALDAVYARLREWNAERTAAK